MNLMIIYVSIDFKHILWKFAANPTAIQYLNYIFIQILIYLHDYTDAIPYVTNNVQTHLRSLRERIF